MKKLFEIEKGKNRKNVHIHSFKPEPAFRVFLFENKRRQIACKTILNMEVPELTREMCMELIEFITVDECPDKYSKQPREIHIYYKLIDKSASKEQFRAWENNK